MKFFSVFIVGVLFCVASSAVIGTHSSSDDNIDLILRIPEQLRCGIKVLDEIFEKSEIVGIWNEYKKQVENSLEILDDCLNEHDKEMAAR